MQLRKLRKAPVSADSLISIAPIYKVSFQGEPKLIGSGFWVTHYGHLVTARHVIDDNAGKDGVDEGPIYAMQTLPDRQAIPRVLRKSWRHDTFDLALSETLVGDELGEVSTTPVLLTLDEPVAGAQIATHAFVSTQQEFTNEKIEGTTTASFQGALAIPELGVEYDLSFSARAGFGYVTDVFPDKRDSVMMPFPCVQSDIPIYGANSGGPVYDSKGRVCAINCTSYAGADISFHMPTKGVLDLFARDIELIPEDPVARMRSIFELGLARRVPFDPPLSKVFYTLPQRMLLWPYHVWLDALARLRWRASGHWRRSVVCSAREATLPSVVAGDVEFEPPLHGNWQRRGACTKMQNKSLPSRDFPGCARGPNLQDVVRAQHRRLC